MVPSDTSSLRDWGTEETCGRIGAAPPHATEERIATQRLAKEPCHQIHGPTAWLGLRLVRALGKQLGGHTSSAPLPASRLIDLRDFGQVLHHEVVVDEPIPTN